MKPRIPNELYEIGLKVAEEYQDMHEAVAIFGSAVSGNVWQGSDVNILAVESSIKPITSSVTNYLFDPLNLDTPRIIKSFRDRRLVQVEIIPSSIVNQELILDWVLCDRLFNCKVIHDKNGELTQTVADIQKKRFSDDSRHLRIQWYLNQIVRLCNADSESLNNLFNLRVSSLFLTCAYIENASEYKKSYKRLSKQLKECAPPDIVDSIARVKGVEKWEQTAIASVLKKAQGLLKEMSDYLKNNPRLIKKLSEGTRSSLMTSMDISSSGIPAGKGVIENLESGDFQEALDSLRQASIWLFNALAKINYDCDSASFDPLTYIDSIENLNYKVDGIVDYLVELFNLHDDNYLYLRQTVLELVQELKSENRLSEVER